MEQPDPTGGKESATTGIHRDNLRPKVREYADKLSRQVKDAFTDHGIEKAEDLGTAIETGRLSMDEARRINKILSTIYEITRTGELPFDFDEEEYMEAIITMLIPKWEEWHRNRPSGELDHYYYPPLVEQLLPELPQIPEELLQTDELFMGRLIDVLYTNISEDHRYYLSGLLTSMIIQDAAKSDADFTQLLDLNRLGIQTDHLGFRWKRGRLEIKGDYAGDYLGCQMQNGEIIAEKVKARDFVGRNMRNGKIQVKKAGNFLGDNMQGGEIEVEEAGGFVGYGMENGTINISNSFDSISTRRTGGEIYLKGNPI